MKMLPAHSLKLFILFVIFYHRPFCQDAISGIQNKVLEYDISHYQEKIFVHTDKELYVAGEIMWFRVYHLDAMSHKSSNISKVAYAELIDKNSKAILQAKISLKDEQDNGSFALPFSLPTDTYVLRCYTNNMKNEGPISFFEKRIVIINTQRNPPPSVLDSIRTYHLQLLPEGGNLVKGIPARVAYYITDQFGHGVDCKGFILKDKNDTIGSLGTPKFGMGSFYFTPLTTTGYSVVAQLPNGETLYQDLPLIFEHGYCMQLSEEDSLHISLLIRSNEKAAGVYLLTQTRQAINISEPVILTNGGAKVIIEKSRLGFGINQITIFNSSGEPMCERLFFIRPPVEENVRLFFDKRIFNEREKVVLHVSKADTSKPIAASVSLSITRIDTDQSIVPGDITSYLWLSSELKGEIENPHYYFSNDHAVGEVTDNLMLTIGWRRFRWEDKVRWAKSKLKYPVEYNGHLISARVTDVRSGKPAVGISVFLSIPTATIQLYSAESNKDGIVKFDVTNYHGNGEIIMQVSPQLDSFYRIRVINPFYENDTSLSSEAYVNIKANLHLLEDYNIAMQVENIYNSDSVSKFSPVILKDTLPFYGRPEYSYNLDDYTRFTTMEEVFREYVKDINVGTKSGSLRLKLVNSTESNFEQDGLVLMDGIPLFDVNKIFAVDPLTIRKLDVIPRNYVLGPTSFTTLASFSTYEGRGQAVELDKSAVIIDYEGIQSRREFFSPSYENAGRLSSKMPDFRSTLYWNPNIRMDQKSLLLNSFYTSDMKGRYLVSLQGINDDGKPISCFSEIEVK